MSRKIKCRVYSKRSKVYIYYYTIGFSKSGELQYISDKHGAGPVFAEDYIVEQYTGLKDKNGKEIYENCELDGRYRVEYIAPEFVGKDMVKGDIIELYDNKFTITKEHCEISQNSERGTN